MFNVNYKSSIKLYFWYSWQRNEHFEENIQFLVKPHIRNNDMKKKINVLFLKASQKFVQNLTLFSNLNMYRVCICNEFECMFTLLNVSVNNLVQFKNQQYLEIEVLGTRNSQKFDILV